MIMGLLDIEKIFVPAITQLRRTTAPEEIFVTAILKPRRITHKWMNMTVPE